MRASGKQALGAYAGALLAGTPDGRTLAVVAGAPQVIKDEPRRESGVPWQVGSLLVNRQTSGRARPATPRACDGAGL